MNPYEKLLSEAEGRPFAAIVGWPVDHSRSPRLHGYWLQQSGIDGAYVPFATHPSKLEQGIRALPSLGFRGGNITLPHKERALGFVDELTPVAKRIGAINMLVVREDGTILGDNSDGFGFIANLLVRPVDPRFHMEPEGEREMETSVPGTATGSET